MSASRRGLAWGRRAGLPALVALLLVVVGLAGPASAQAVAQLPPTPSGQARFSLLTVGPGPQVHALFGHTAFRLVDPVYRLDITYNYGTFDFGPDFIPRFIHGELDYFLDVRDTRYLVAEADYDGRGVIEQQLDLTPDQTSRLYVALRENAQPDRRTYRYDFLYDNCSTRPLDMLVSVLGEALRLPDGAAPGPSFREQVDAHLDEAPWLDLGIHLSLGSEVDQPGTVEQGWFLPDGLRVALEQSTLDGHALVLATRTLMPQPPEPPSTTPLVLRPLVLAWTAVVLAALGLLRRLVTRRRRSSFVDRTLFGLLGLAGLTLLYFWAGTLHHVADHNWNLAWAWPTHAVAVFWIGRGPLPRWLQLYLLAAAGAAAVAAGGWGIPQHLPAAVTPLGVLIVLRVLTLLSPARADETD